MIGSLDESLHRGLKPVSSTVPAFVSPGLETDVAETIERVERAHAFFVSALGIEPRLAVLVLGPTEWAQRSNHPLYGMPNYRDGNLVLAGQPNPFWGGLVELAVGEIPDAARLLEGVYRSERGGADLSPFFDLLGVHELAHIFIEAGGRVPAQLWVLELACNVFLHTYVATEEPKELAALETFPAVFARIASDRFTHQTLADFEASYAQGMDGANYAWFQSRFHVAAKRIYDAGGASVPSDLWRVLAEAGADGFEELVAERLGRTSGDVLRRLTRTRTLTTEPIQR